MTDIYDCVFPTIYVVMGTTGEYSDRTEWPVVAYTNESDARRHVELAGNEAKTIFATRKDRYSTDGIVNPFDPKMEMDYMGTEYFIHSTVLSADVVLNEIIAERRGAEKGE